MWSEGSRERSNSFTHYTSKHLKGARHIKQGVWSQAFEECQQFRVGTCLHEWTVLVNGYFKLRIAAHVHHAQYGHSLYTSIGQINQISL